MSTLRNKIFHHLVQNHTLVKTAGMGPLATLVTNRIEALEKGKKSIPVTNGRFNGNPKDFDKKEMPATIYYFGGSSQLIEAGMEGIVMSQPPTSTASPDQLVAAAVNSFTAATGCVPSGVILNRIGFSAGAEKLSEYTRVKKNDVGKFVADTSNKPREVSGVMIQDGANMYNDGLHPGLEKDEKGNYKSPKLTIVAESAYAAATDPNAPPFIMMFSSVIASRQTASGQMKRYTSSWQTGRAIMEILKSRGVQFKESHAQQLTSSGVVIDFYATAGKCSFIGINQELLNTPGGYEYIGKSQHNAGTAYDVANSPGTMGNQHVDLGMKGHALALEELKRMWAGKVKIA